MGQDPYNGEYMGVIWFDAEPSWGPTNMFPEGDWIIEVTPLNPGKAAPSMTCGLTAGAPGTTTAPTTHPYSFYDSCFRQLATHQEYQLDWAASPDVLTTGAWTTRNEWLGADGNMHYPWEPYMLEPKINTITYFSSPGPSRDGRMKPDIAAPGAIIMSTMPANLAGGIANSNKDPDMQHQWMWGTSMAAPHSTGAVALYLQKFPGHTFANVRYYLSNWAQERHVHQVHRQERLRRGQAQRLQPQDPARGQAHRGQGRARPEQPRLRHLQRRWVPTTRTSSPSSTSGSCSPSRPAPSASFTPNGNTAKLVPDKVGAYKVGLVDRGRDLQQPDGRGHGAGRRNDRVRGFEAAAAFERRVEPDEAGGFPPASFFQDRNHDQ